MLGDLTSSQRQLADFMSQLSESAYSAGWMENLEHALWRAVVEGPFRYGHLNLTTEHIAILEKLSQACRGWIQFDDKQEEVFVPIERWLSGGYNRVKAT